MSKRTQKMIALRNIPNSGRYGTRMLVTGDPFEATPRDAKVLIAAKLAHRQRDIGSIQPPPSSLRAKVAKPAAVDDDLAAAREEYQTKMGKRPFHGWSADELRAKMADAESDETPKTDEADEDEE